MTETILEFTSGVRRSEPITFTLDGQQYTVRPAKEAVKLLQNRFVWFDHGLNAADWANLDDAAKRAAHSLDTEDEAGPLGPSDPTPTHPPEGWQGPQAAGLEKRLRDVNDGFDVADLERIITGIEETVAGRPTT